MVWKAVFIKVNIWKVRLKDLVFLLMKMVISTLDISFRANSMALGSILGLMEVVIRDFSKLESIIVMVNIHTLVAQDILENTKMAYKMAWG